MSLLVKIKKQLGDFHLDVSFEAKAQALALLGSSGCGKTVTLRCIAGIMTPDSGHIELDGTVLFDSKKNINIPAQQRHVGYVFQQYALFPHMTVRQNIACGYLPKQGRYESVDNMIQRVGLSEVSSLYPHQLSGGQKQRTALARILISDPKAILLDEPFSSQDLL